jgi:hypothetical protein
MEKISIVFIMSWSFVVCILPHNVESFGRFAAVAAAIVVCETYPCPTDFPRLRPFCMNDMDLLQAIPSQHICMYSIALRRRILQMDESLWVRRAAMMWKYAGAALQARGQQGAAGHAC